MSEFHLAQVCIIQPVIAALEKAAIPASPLLRKAGLNAFKLHDPCCYIPLKQVYSFLDLVCQRHGEDQFVKLVAPVCKVLDLGELGDMVGAASDLLEACRMGEKYASRVMTHEEDRLVIEGALSRYVARFSDHPYAGRSQLGVINLSVILDGFRLAGGPEWSPLELNLQADTVVDPDVPLPIGRNTRVRFNQPETAVRPRYPVSIPWVIARCRCQVTHLCNLMDIDGTDLSDQIRNIAATSKIIMMESRQ